MFKKGPGTVPALLSFDAVLSLYFELVLAGAADGAEPGGRQLLERGAGGDIIIRVAQGGVIDVAAKLAYVFFHFVLLKP